MHICMFEWLSADYHVTISWPEVPYSCHTVLTTRVHESSVVIETNTSNILVHPFKYIYLDRDSERACWNTSCAHQTQQSVLFIHTDPLNHRYYQERIRGRSVQLPYNRLYYRSPKSAAMRCCYSELGPFLALCSSLLPASTLHPTRLQQKQVSVKP